MIDDRPPLREVEEVRTLTGPRGGTVLVLRFACGHQTWQRVKKLPADPTKPRRCMGCWVDAAMARPTTLEDA